jgi:hypothetical protein
MNSLFDTDKELQSTKDWTGFLKIYDKYFKNYKNKEINILEIGVDKGKSLELWRNYFTKAKICGIDIAEMNFKIDGVELITADQTNLKSLKEICEKYKSFDIIIDDGSHVSKHIIASFSFLFDYLSDDGLYAVEDLQTSYFPRFGGSRINLKTKKTALNFLKSLTDSINYEHNDKPFYKKKKFDGLIEYIHFYQNISILKKGQSKKIFYKDEKKEKNLIGVIKKIISNFYE